LLRQLSNRATMTYYILKGRGFNTTSVPSERILYLVKRRNIPEDQQREIINLNCSSVQKVDRISDLLIYLNSNTADSYHRPQPYILKKISWTDALNMFGIDSDTDSSESA